MVKPGLKAVKSQYRANKHSAGDPIIKWPQRMKLTSILTVSLSYPIHLLYNVTMGERREKRIVFFKKWSYTSTVTSSSVKHFHSHHPICLLNPFNYSECTIMESALWHGSKEPQPPLCSKLLTLFALVGHREYLYKYFCAFHNQIRVLK